MREVAEFPRNRARESVAVEVQPFEPREVADFRRDRAGEFIFVEPQ